MTLKLTFTFPEDGIFSLDQAREVFQSLAGLEDIAHDYFPNGCYARTHLMCLEIEKLGVIPEKAWIKKEGHFLTVRPLDWTPVGWDYHVAPVLKVRTKNGVENIIFDPGLFNNPTSFEEWSKTMSATVTDIKLTLLGADSPGGGEGGYFYARDLPKEGAEKNAKMLMQDHIHNKLLQFVHMMPRFNSKWAKCFEGDTLKQNFSGLIRSNMPPQGASHQHERKDGNGYRRGPPNSKKS